jgi:biotin transporter BioY
MKFRVSLWLVGGFVVSFLAVGIPFWRIPYSQVALPDTIVTPALLVTVAAALLARRNGRHSFLATMLVIAASLPAVILARVGVDTAQDPTSHNLWPFEVFFAWIVGLPAAAAGALLARVMPARDRP